MEGNLSGSNLPDREMTRSSGLSLGGGAEGNRAGSLAHATPVRCFSSKRGNRPDIRRHDEHGPAVLNPATAAGTAAANVRDGDRRADRGDRQLLRLPAHRSHHRARAGLIGSSGAGSVPRAAHRPRVGDRVAVARRDPLRDCGPVHRGCADPGSRLRRQPVRVRPAPAFVGAGSSAVAAQRDQPGHLPTPGTSSPETTEPAPADQVVENFYDAINAHDYQTAWALLGGNKLGQTYQQFVAGFARTADDALAVTGVNGDTVTVELVATQDDGRVRTYRGTYTVQGGRIVQANIRRVS